MTDDARQRSREDIDAAIAALNRALLRAGPKRTPELRAAVRKAMEAAWAARKLTEET